MCINFAISFNPGIKTVASQPGAKKKKSQTLPSGKVLTCRQFSGNFDVQTPRRGFNIFILLESTLMGILNTTYY